MGAVIEDSVVRDMTQRMVGIFESFVRRYPDQWYGFRDMWPS